MATLLDYCNEALAEIGAGSIASLAENSIEARECNRFYQRVLNELADWTEWPFRNSRVVLASLANDRTAEWSYAYALPADAATILAIREPAETVGYLPTYGPFARPFQDTSPDTFTVESGVIYTNVETATAIYARKTLTADDLPPLVGRAFAMELAARIAFPVKKDRTIKGDMIKQAAVAKAIAIADERNKAPQMETRYVSEVEYARAGLI